MEQSSSTHVVIQTTRSTSIQSFCTKPLIRCHHHHVPPNPFALLDTPLLREPTRLPPLALILYSDRTVRYRPQQSDSIAVGLRSPLQRLAVVACPLIACHHFSRATCQQHPFHEGLPSCEVSSRDLGKSFTSQRDQSFTHWSCYQSSFLIDGWGQQLWRRI